MDELHARLIRICLAALADDFGFALAGGYAIQAHQIVNRLSDDVDLFTPFERRDQMPAATTRALSALWEEGLEAEAATTSETYVRLQVTDPATGRETKVELVAEFLSHPPVEAALGPVLHPDDVAAGKMTALFSRAEVRDFIDVDGLLRAGYTRERLIELAEQRDGGFDTAVLADMFASIQRFNDRQFASYGIDVHRATIIRGTFLRWREQLLPGNSSSPRGTAARARSGLPTGEPHMPASQSQPLTEAPRDDGRTR
ncbi:nucleotidyl transferase AbiEii/AbiGii toxin family protein [Kitasatospora sp. NBC_01266]|uniref:nucleotidyl transferase AbiEii/AbiGii toxin family protein n=1 Tax=Kitasatospora sp. NBC_01266 TaxID=2903572 RepID=UPI002E339E35|nr:nucleotidyl transferase AbiEii/AbiGii toxin family protein [Kitasatospora sp. NBC_01266]